MLLQIRGSGQLSNFGWVQEQNNPHIETVQKFGSPSSCVQKPHQQNSENRDLPWMRKAKERRFLISSSCTQDDGEPFSWGQSTPHLYLLATFPSLHNFRNGIKLSPLLY